MKLLIALPALNEEESIASIIERCLAAGERIISGSLVTEVELTVVSDGSTDQTVEIASRYVPRIKLIVFEKNRGYGAAIQEAWTLSDAELLGFLDADGTCDPEFFAPLCRTLIDEGACVVLGSRMHGESELPLVRRVGNALFALLLTLFSFTRVRDAASGMRVVRRNCLDRLMPLPDGLDFTPAMSARCILASDLPIREIDMPYAERAGRSKLSVLRDGVRFLRVIAKTVLLYRSSRVMGMMAVLLVAVAAALMLGPTVHYLRHRSVTESMIYRFVVSQLLGVAAVALLCMGYLARRIVVATLTVGSPAHSHFDWMAAWMESWYFWPVPLAFLLTGGVLVYPSYRQLVTTGATYEHWSRFIVMSFFAAAALLLLITRVVHFVLDVLCERLRYLSGELEGRRRVAKTGEPSADRRAQVI